MSSAGKNLVPKPPHEGEKGERQESTTANGGSFMSAALYRINKKLPAISIYHHQSVQTEFI